MRCLVTGASGFLGRRLVDLLRTRRHEVWAIVHDADVKQPAADLLPSHQIHVIRGSVDDLHCCERAIVESQADAVFHLAAQAIVPHARRDPFNTFEANVRGTYSLLEAFRRYRGPQAVAVIASSDKAYGDPGIGGVYHEISPLRGRGPYDVSKSCADLIAQSYAHEFGLPIGIVRAGNIYGPGDVDMTRIVPCVASALASGRNPELTSDGTPVRDYLYVSDAAEAYELLAEYVMASGGGAHAFNFSGGEPISALGLAETAIRVWNRGLTPIIRGTRKGEIQSQVLDSSLARKTLSWHPRVKLEIGLKNTIEWWRDQSRVRL